MSSEEIYSIRKGDMSFEGRIATQRKVIEEETARKEREAALEEERLRVAAEEAKKHPIFKEMRDIANSPELEEALRRLFDLEISSSVFSLKINDRHDCSKHYPFGVIFLELPFGSHTDGSYDPITERPSEDIIQDYLRINVEYFVNTVKANNPTLSIHFDAPFNRKDKVFHSLDSLLEYIAEYIIERERVIKYLAER